MALVSKGYVLNVTVVDNTGNKSNPEYSLVAATAGDAATATATILAALDAVTDGVIAGYTLGEKFEEDALVLPASGVQVEKYALVTCKIDGEALKTGNLRIPAPNQGIAVGTSGKAASQIDPNDAALQAYVNLFGTTGVATFSDGEHTQIASASTVEGKIIHRASRKG